ncbi:MAG TPA: hypothetical protein DEB39_04525 [Planctomycetaceae bacterium]|nr:hypothetical protein [Planctomycetaceae bacterium]
MKKMIQSIQVFQPASAGSDHAGGPPTPTYHVHYIIFRAVVQFPAETGRFPVTAFASLENRFPHFPASREFPRKFHTAAGYPIMSEKNIEPAVSDETILSLDSLQTTFLRLEEQESSRRAERHSPELREDAAIRRKEEVAFLRVFGDLMDTAEADEEKGDGADAFSEWEEEEESENDSDPGNVANRADGGDRISGIDEADGIDRADSGVTASGLEEKTIPLTPETILEAMLFVGDRENRPLTASKAAELMRNVEPEEIEPLITRLNERYGRAGRPYRILAEHGGFRMILDPAFDSILAKFYGKIREAKLSQQVIDVLAVVAYRQPITTEEVQAIRKAPSGGILSQLVRRGLLGIERKLEAQKPVLFYRTTDRFLQLFGLDSLDDLPTPEEIDFR